MTQPDLYRREVRCERTGVLIKTEAYTLDELLERARTQVAAEPVVEFTIREPGQEPRTLRYFALNEESWKVVRWAFKKLEPKPQRKRAKKKAGGGTGEKRTRARRRSAAPTAQAPDAAAGGAP